METRENMVQEEEIVIVGGGIAGLATAVALKRVGLNSRVLESHWEHRSTGTSITLFPNAWFALRALGVDHKLTPLYPKFEKALARNLETGVTLEQSFVATNDRGTEIGVRSVHRKALLHALAEELAPDTIRFSSKLISIKTEILQDSSKITVLHLDDGTVIKAKVVIGCDGVHSSVAQWLGLSQPIDSGRAAFRGLSYFPEGHGFDYTVRQYLGHGMRAGLAPINSKEIYWFLVHYSSSLENKDISRSPELMMREVTENLAKDFPSEFLTTIEKTDLSTVSWATLLFRAPWNVAFGPTRNGNVTVAGDAMHPMTPDLGQGGCSALEDAVILARCLGRARDAGHGNKWPEEGFKRYVEERRWRVTWLVVGAWFSGWVQQGAGGDQEWWSKATRWFRDRFFYKFVSPWIRDSLWFDSGDLTPSN